MKLIKKMALLLVLIFSFNTTVLADDVDKYTQQCDSGNGKGCFNLGNMYRNGKGVKQDDSKAVEYYQKACDLDIGAGCFNLGFMYDNGEGVRQSNQKALKYYGKACDLKEPFGCKNYTKLKKQMKQ